MSSTEPREHKQVYTRSTETQNTWSTGNTQCSQVLELSPAIVICSKTPTRGTIWECFVPNNKPEKLSTRCTDGRSNFILEVYWEHCPRWLGRWSACLSRSISWVQVSPGACSYIGAYYCTRKNIDGKRESAS